MTLNSDNRRKRPDRPDQTRGQKIVMIFIFAIVAAMAIAAAVIYFVSGSSLF